MSDTKTRRYGAARLKRAVLAILDQRIAACRSAEAKYDAMAKEPGGGVLGSAALAKLSASTERSARLEAQLIRDRVAELPASGEAARAPPSALAPRSAASMRDPMPPPTRPCWSSGASTGSRTCSASPSSRS